MSGEPKTADELSVQIPEPHSIRTLGNYLLSDPRFRRRGLKHYGLDVWGGEEYTKIADEIADELVKLGGEADLEHLVETLSSRFGVSPSSVRTYARGRQFVRSATGVVRLRRPDAALRPTKLDPPDLGVSSRKVRGCQSKRPTVPGLPCSTG